MRHRYNVHYRYPSALNNNAAKRLVAGNRNLFSKFSHLARDMYYLSKDQRRERGAEEMTSLLIDLPYLLAAALIGAAGASWFWWSRFGHGAGAERGAEANYTAGALVYAAEVLVRLERLTTQAASDVEEHSSQVEQINQELTSVGKHEPKKLVNVVTRLMEANQRMQSKLAATEKKLREQAHQMQTYSAEAHTDALTLLANRRAFDDELDRRFAEFTRHGRAFSVVMADIDEFKKFNDAHGHPAGDEVLRAVSKLLRREMREMDLVARYGGEEFAIILPETDLNEAGKAADRARAAIAKSVFRCAGTELCQFTVSFGVAAAPSSLQGDDLLSRADKALYAAKAAGRNCVFCHDGEHIARFSPSQEPALPAAAAQLPPQPPPGKAENGGQPSAAAEGGATEREANVPRTLDLGMFTDLPSRTTFCQQVRNRTSEWKKGGPTFSILLIEVNQDGAGDGELGPVLRVAATQSATSFLTSLLRTREVAGRYGPGCFALLLPAIGLAEAIGVAERLQEEFCRSTALPDGPPLRLTLSIGVVQVTAQDDSISVLKRAEAALDAADRSGGKMAYYHDGRSCAPASAMLAAGACGGQYPIPRASSPWDDRGTGAS
jgi:diguanylate cyclase